MPAATPDDRKRRAFICALVLTGSRVKTLSMVRMKHVDLADGVLYLDAREVPTKFSRSFITPFMPVGDDFETEFRNWILYLRDELNFAPDAPVFPKPSTKSVPGAGFVNAGLSHEFYKSSTPLAASVSAGFESAGLPRSTCHRFRDMLIQMGKDQKWPIGLMVCLSAAIGHNDLSVTLSSYAHPTDEKLISVFKELREKKKNA